MKKLIVLIAAVVCFAAHVYSQPVYYVWYPVASPVTNNLNYIYNNSATHLIAGNDGKMLYRITPGTNWSVANTGTTANLMAVFGQSTLLTVGASGTIKSSTDNGLNWSAVASPVTTGLNSLNTFLTQSYRMICGDGGVIYTTMNYGANWTVLPSGTTNNLRYVCFNNNVTPWRSFICGDNGTLLKIVYTLPLPVTITVIPVNTGITNNLFGVSMLGDTNTILCAGSGGKIIKSTNGGSSWAQQNSGTTNTLRYILAVNANDVWICGDNGTMLHTTNGGTNWYQQIVQSTANINSMMFLTSVKAIAVGSGGTILECNFPNPSSDTTIKWSLLNKNNISSYFISTGIFNQNITTSNTPGFEWPKGSSKYAIFSSGLSIAGKINGNLRQAMCSYKGEFWPGQIIGGNPQTFPAANKIWKVSAGDNCMTSIDWANWGLIVPYGAPYRDMNNNGVYDPCTDIPGMRNASQTLFLILTDGFANTHSPGEGFGGGTLPLNADMKITAYTYGDSALNDVQFIKFDIINRGTSAWNNLYMSLVGDFDMGDANDDYICMDSTRNMWIGYNGDNSDPVYGMSPPAVGMRVIKFLVNKTVAPYDTVKTTSGVHFICTSCAPPPCESDPNGEPLGAYNMMRGYKKDGSKWMNPTFTPPRPVKFIYGGEPEPNTGWTELKGSIRNCGGDTGAYVPVNPPGDRRYVLSMGKENFTMNPGDSQTIIVAQMIARGTSNTNSVTKLKQLSDLVANYTVGIKNVSTEIPANYSLGLNYPNPFNNTSNLKFEIANLSNVKVLVYDITGRLIQTLVNEELQPGSYEVTFDGTGLNSGVYFYQLVAGSYKETRRMVLVK